MDNGKHCIIDLPIVDGEVCR